MQRLERQLPFLASVNARTPQRFFGITDVRDPRRIFRKGDPGCRDTTQVWNEFIEALIESHELAAILDAQRKQLPSISAWRSLSETHRTIGEVNRFIRCSRKHLCAFAKHPE